MKSRFQTQARIVQGPQRTQSARTVRSRVVDADRALTFSLKPVPPFRLDLTVWTLRRRASNLIDRWDGQTYRRVLVLKNSPVEAAVSQTGSSNTARIHVTLTGRRIFSETKTLAIQSLERLLGLRIDLTEFYRLSATDKKLSPLVGRFRGAKPPRFPTIFEALVNGIACQQMSLSLGILLLSRLTEKFGKSIKSAHGEVHAFPRPKDMMELEPGDFRELGFSLQKGRAIIGLTRVCSTGEIQLEKLESLDNRSIVNQLIELRGIGRWSAEYVLLRGLGRLAVYPGDDVGARNNLKRWLNLRKPLDYEGVRRITSRWQPYAGLVYFHMLLDRLAASEGLAPGSAEKTIPERRHPVF
jgi:DNA-3-methyladenine glycosylase II